MVDRDNRTLLETEGKRREMERAQWLQSKHKIKSVPLSPCFLLPCPGDSKVESARRRDIIHKPREREFMSQSCLRTKEPGLAGEP